MQLSNRRDQTIFLCAALMLLGAMIGYKIGVWVCAGKFEFGWIEMAYLPLIMSVVGVLRKPAP